MSQRGRGDLTVADGITLTREEATALYQSANRGMALDNFIATLTILGLTPAGALTYLHPEPSTDAALVKDLIAWASGRTAEAPGCVERIEQFGADMARQKLEHLAEQLGLGPVA